MFHLNMKSALCNLPLTAVILSALTPYVRFFFCSMIHSFFFSLSLNSSTFKKRNEVGKQSFPADSPKGYWGERAISSDQFSILMVWIRGGAV